MKHENRLAGNNWLCGRFFYLGLWEVPGYLRGMDGFSRFIHCSCDPVLYHFAKGLGLSTRKEKEKEEKVKPERIILHHSLTKDSDTVSWGPIREFHTLINGWTDIGYHFGIENLRGQTEILAGRMPDKTGAHCGGHNTGSIGVCFIGNFDADFVPASSWDAGVKLCRFLTRAYGIREIKGHREFNPHKSCPGKNFNLSKFRRAVFL